MSNETDFRNAKVGDKVWDLLSGWGKILSIACNCTEYPLTVGFTDELGHTFSEFYGWEGGSCRHPPLVTLFWDEVKIVPPPRPKRLVNKKAYVIAVETPNTPDFHISFVAFHTQEEAERYSRKTFMKLRFNQPQIVYYTEEE